MEPGSTMEIFFPGGLAVEAFFDGFKVRSDQPISHGGQHSAPTPFDFFLASIGTCSGYYALRFCQERGLSLKGLKLILAIEKDFQTHRLSKIKISISLPEKFPEKYHRAIIRAVNQCSVKHTILDPPEFVTATL